jgi:hypothetical protein
MPGKRLLSSVETAKLLRTTQGALANLRCQGRGPTFYRIGRRILYDINDINEFIDNHRVERNYA